MDANTQKAAEAADIAAPPPIYNNMSAPAPNQYNHAGFDQQPQQQYLVGGVGINALRKVYGRLFVMTLIRCVLGVVLVALGAVVLTQKPAHDALAIAAWIVAFGALNIFFLVKPKPRSINEASVPSWYGWINFLYMLGWASVVGLAINQTINGDNDPVSDKPSSSSGYSSGYSYDDTFSQHWKRRTYYFGGWDLISTTIGKMFLASGIVAILGT